VTPRQRLARILRRLAARLDDRRITPADVEGHDAALRRLGVVPSGYAQGRADAQLTHTPTGHYGDGDGHSCRCDSWRLAPHLRGRPHACLCTDGPEEPSHLPPGGPPWITASTAGNPL
jgi:hypothetical protein